MPAAAGVQVGGRGGCSGAAGAGLPGLPSGPRAAASGRRWRPFSPGDRRSRLPGSHLQGRGRVLRGVRARRGPVERKQGQPCCSSKERRTFPPLEQVGPKAPLPGSILASPVCRPPGSLVPREPRMGRDLLSEARHQGPPRRKSSQTASRLRVSMHHLGGEGFCQSRTRGNELTEDPTHVEQGGELPGLLDIKVIC